MGEATEVGRDKKEKEGELKTDREQRVVNKKERDKE